MGYHKRLPRRVRYGGAARQSEPAPVMSFGAELEAELETYFRAREAEEREMEKPRVPYHCAPMGELREMLEDWQKEHCAPYSALKICLEGFLIREERRIMGPTVNRPRPR